MRTQIVVFLISAFLLAGCTNKGAEEARKPNILFLLADDLGYGDLGCYGQEIIETPVLDDLASKGMRFTDFYAGNSVCSPSRAVLMTGKHSGINTVRGNKGIIAVDRWDRIALRKDEITLAEMLREAGYQTGFIGKWHLDDPDDLGTWAHNRGFEHAVQEQWASPFGGRPFAAHWEWINGLEDSVLFEPEKWNCQDEFRTKLAFDYLDGIDRDRPFFLFMSYRAPHAHEPPIGNKKLYADRGWPEIERQHAAKITLLDRQIGRMLEKLDEMGELENTLVVFTSDNGPHSERGHDHHFFNSNGDLRGYKRDLYEGGIRIPFIAFWKGRIEQGTVSSRLGGFQDFMPTLAEAAGIEKPEQSDGISLLPVLLGGSAGGHEYLNIEFLKPGPDGFRQSVRIGQWKGVRYGLDSPIEIYDLETDISEQNDIAGEHPELAERMNQIFIESRNETRGFPYGGKLPADQPGH